MTWPPEKSSDGRSWTLPSWASPPDAADAPTTSVWPFSGYGAGLTPQWQRTAGPLASDPPVWVTGPHGLPTAWPMATPGVAGNVRPVWASTSGGLPPDAPLWAAGLHGVPPAWPEASELPPHAASLAIHAPWMVESWGAANVGRRTGRPVALQEIDN